MAGDVKEDLTLLIFASPEALREATGTRARGGGWGAGWLMALMHWGLGGYVAWGEGKVWERCNCQQPVSANLLRDWKFPWGLHQGDPSFSDCGPLDTALGAKMDLCP